MGADPQRRDVLRYLLVMASLVIVVGGLKAGAPIFLPLLLGFFLAVISFPMVFGLRRRRVPAWLAIVLTMLTVIGVFTGIALFLTAAVNGISSAVPRYQARFKDLVNPALERLNGMGFDVGDTVTGEILDLDSLINVVTNTFFGVASALSVGVLVLLIMLFILLESVGFRHKLSAALGPGNDVLLRFAKINREVQRYLVIKTGISLMTGLLVGVWVWLVGLDFPLLWGFVAFVCNYVPTIGSVVAGVPAVLLALVQQGPGMALVTFLGYLVINFFLGNLLEPNLLGRTLRLSPLVVVLSLVFWGWIWGPIGMLLAVPITMVAKIMMEHTESLRWLSVLLAKGRPQRLDDASAPSAQPSSPTPSGPRPLPRDAAGS